MSAFPPNKTTIAAIATPAGRGGIGIVRVSGPLSFSIAEKILGFKPQIRHAHYASFFDEKHEILDQGIALFFQAPSSFTGEDILELQGHGGPIVLDRILTAVLFYGAELARAGEFSEQAFLNGKLDLAQAEAISDLIHAESEQAARSALRSLQGEFSLKINHLVNDLIQLRMYVEAAIDFPEEEIDFLTQSHVLRDAHHILEKIQKTLEQAQQGALIRDGITVVIAGEPNVGKSSLLNCLSQRDSAIVTPIAGTTRDVLKEKILLDGMPINIIDTAGLRETHDVVEQEGIRRAKAALLEADLVLYLLDASQEKDMGFILEHLSKNMPESIPSIIIFNKIDLVEKAPSLVFEDNKPCLFVSIKEKLGIDLIIETLKQKVGYQTTTEGTFIARRRHIDSLHQAISCLERGIEQLEIYRAGELLAEELRLAQEALNHITGQFTSDDLLGEIFSSFCIGK